MISSLVNSICQLSEFICEKQLELSGAEIQRNRRRGIASDSFWNGMMFHECQAQCKNTKTHIINKAYFEYMLKVKN